jgi:hypothetical protein
MAARVAALAAVALLASGCPTQEQLAHMPGLGDVTPLGPDGKKCYDHCAQLKVHCDHMCPNSMGICREDCVTESKICLKDCPELQRPVYPED